MAVVDLKLPHHQYQIAIEPGLLSRLGELASAVAPHDKAAILSDAAVSGTHLPVALKALSGASYHVQAHEMQGGEASKTLDTVRAAYDKLIAFRMERRSPIVALGGGVIGDTAGFVAATYLRGVPFIQCPTTLLAMVDASVGGKVGVNLPQGKNLVGAFYQPMLVAIDTDTLATLPPRELRCGLAECIKHAVIRDARLFDFIEQNLDAILKLDAPALVELVRWNVQIKADVVMADEKESGQRAHLNFGHTFAHAIETTQAHAPQAHVRPTGASGYHHGEAVALGMVAAVRLAAAAGRCDAALGDRLVDLLARIGLPTHAPDLAPTPRLIDTMRLDKKVADGRIRLVLPDSLGAVSITPDTDDNAIAAAWETLRT